MATQLNASTLAHSEDKQPSKPTLYFCGGTYSPAHYGHLAITKSCLTENTDKAIMMVTADGHPVLGKTPSAPAKDRFEMTRLAAHDTHDPRILASNIEILLSHITGLPSYTVMTVFLLREGSDAFRKKIEDNKELLLTPEERKKLDPQLKTDLIAQKFANFSNKFDEKQATLDAAIHQLSPSGKTFLSTQEVNFMLVMGSDSFNSFSCWNGFREIIQFIDGIVVTQREEDSLDPKLTQYLQNENKTLRINKANTGILGSLSSTRVRELIKNEPLAREQKILLEQFIPTSVRQYIEKHALYGYQPQKTNQLKS